MLSSTGHKKTEFRFFSPHSLLSRSVRQIKGSKQQIILLPISPISLYSTSDQPILRYSKNQNYLFRILIQHIVYALKPLLLQDLIIPNLLLRNIISLKSISGIIIACNTICYLFSSHMKLPVMKNPVRSISTDILMTVQSIICCLALLLPSPISLILVHACMSISCRFDSLEQDILSIKPRYKPC